jgi:hypothetical protein
VRDHLPTPLHIPSGEQELEQEIFPRIEYGGITPGGALA